MVAPSRYLLEQQLEKQLRQRTGLSGKQGLHPVPKPFYRQSEALDALHKLTEDVDYTPSQVGLFAQELGAGGKRRFLVNTFAGFALERAPRSWPQEDEPLGNFYEVIQEDRPCWFYFDLEYSRETNPHLDADIVMAAFRKTLACFCREVLQVDLDVTSVLEMESSTERKFSKHVIVKRVRPASGEVRALAFPNNAQAGLLVSSLVQYAALHRADGGDALFVQAPKADDGQEREVCIIDESVYSRNRSFRLLFQSKFGKKRRLDLDAGSAKLAFGVKPHPCFALLETMASFVPDGTELFEHALIPRGFAHMQAKASRSSVIRHKNGSVQAECDPLLNYLIRAWDDIRRLNDTSPMPFEPTSVQSCVEMDERFLTVTLNNNRYCFCKGASHKSNHIYLVVDTQQASFHQKCFDIACRHYASPPFKIPCWIIDTSAEEEEFSNLISAGGDGFQVADVADVPQKRMRISEGGA